MNNTKAILKALSEQNLQEIKKLNPNPGMICGIQEQRLLHIAAKQSNPEILSFLLEHSLLEVTDSIGRTPLHYAASYGQLENLILLIQKGANVNAQTIGGDTPLSKSFQYPQCYEHLIKAGANASLLNSIGESVEQILQQK